MRGIVQGLLGCIGGGCNLGSLCFDTRKCALLKAFAETLSKGCQDPAGESLIPKFLRDDDCWKSLHSTLLQTLRFCRMCLCLVAPANYGTFFDDVQYYTKYAGKSIFVKAVKANLTQPLAPDAKKDDHAFRNHILALVKDVNRTAASLVEAQPDFNRARSIVEGAAPSVEDLTWVFNKTAYLHKNLRAGQMGEVAKKFAELSLARAIVEDQASTDSKTVTFLLNAMQATPKLAGCSEMENRLKAWANKHNSLLAKKEVAELVEIYVKSAQGDPAGLAQIPLNTAALQSLLPKCKSAAFQDDSDIKALLCRAVAFIIKDGFRKAEHAGRTHLASRTQSLNLSPS